MPVTEETTAQRNTRLAAMEAQVGRDVRPDFHKALGEMGWNPNPALFRGSYYSSHVQAMWEIYLRATIAEKHHDTGATESTTEKPGPDPGRNG